MSSPGARDWALIVGVSRYRDRRFGDLERPERDARDFYAWATSPTRGGITNKKHVRLMLSPDEGANKKNSKRKPRSEQITECLEELEELAKTNAAKKKKLRIGRRLYVSLSAHGFKPTDEETALLTANA